jgi:hypothetical protein
MKHVIEIKIMENEQSIPEMLRVEGKKIPNSTNLYTLFTLFRTLKVPRSGRGTY